MLEVCVSESWAMEGKGRNDMGKLLAGEEGKGRRGKTKKDVGKSLTERERRERKNI